MRIIGFNFTKINAAKLKDSSTAKVDIKSNIHISSIEKAESDLLKDETVISIDFEYTIDYNPDFAKLSFEGKILVVTDETNGKEILDLWSSEKGINPKIRPLVFNSIFTRSNIRALDLEQEINLPPHIPLPRISADSLQDTNSQNPTEQKSETSSE